MGKAPDKCPMCGEEVQWKLVDTTKKDLVLERQPQVPYYSGQQVQSEEHQEKRNNVIIVGSVGLTMNIKKKIIILFMAMAISLTFIGCTDDTEDTIRRGNEAQENIDNAFNEFKDTQDTLFDLAE